MHIDRRLVGFGLFLITVGGVMVAVRQGVLSDDDARQAWTLWPLILVGVGLSIVLAGRPGAASVAWSSRSPSGRCSAASPRPACSRASGSAAAAATRARAFGDSGGDLGAQAEVKVEPGLRRPDDRHGRGLDLEPVRAVAPMAARRGSTAARDSLRISTPDGGPFDIGGSGAWNVVLPRDTSIDLDRDGQRRRRAGRPRRMRTCSALASRPTPARSTSTCARSASIGDVDSTSTSGRRRSACRTGA